MFSVNPTGSLVFGLASCALAAYLAPVGQERPDTRQFTSRTDLVVLDVSVLKGGRAVTGLRASDFTVLEDGQVRSIAAFTEIRTPEPDMPAVGWLREVPSDVESNGIDDARLVVLVLDDAVVPLDARIMQNVKTIGRQIVERLHPDDLTAVVFSLQAEHAQGFTRNRALLLEAIDRFRPGFARGRTSDDALYLLYSLRTLQVTAELLAEVPNRRKIIFYVSPGVPVDHGVVAGATAIGPGAARGMAAADLQRDLSSAQRDLIRGLRQTFWHAQQANVVVYAVDPAGGDGMASYFLRGRRTDYLDAHERARQYTDFLETIADATGGRAVVRTNDPRRAIDEIINENRSYYLLGYQSSAQASTQATRRIEVHVRQPGLTVRSRTGHFAREASAALAALPASDDLTQALSGVIAGGNLRMTITAAPFAAPDGKGAVVAVTIGLRYPAPLDATEAGSLERFDVLASAFTPDGRPRGAHRFDLDFPHRQRDPDVTYERLVTLPLDVGRYHLRVALRNQARNQSGSVYTDVDIPDFSRQPLSLSGLLIERSVSASDRSESQFIPASATTQRAFEPHEPVAAFVRVYERRSDSASSVRVSVRIIDAAENVVYESSETVHPEGTGPLAWADLRVPLPLGRLQSGPHLLAMEASTGREKASRHVRFTLK